MILRVGLSMGPATGSALGSPKPLVSINRFWRSRAPSSDRGSVFAMLGADRLAPSMGRSTGCCQCGSSALTTDSVEVALRPIGGAMGVELGAAEGVFVD